LSFRQRGICHSEERSDEEPAVGRQRRKTRSNQKTRLQPRTTSDDIATKEPKLSVADDLLAANEMFARSFDLGDLNVRPRRHAAVLSCMDSRILFEHCLGLRPGDAHMIRNAGGIATDDAIRSLLVSHHLLDTQEFIIINHTDCGLLKVKENELRAELARKMGTVAAEPAHFYAFDDLEANVRQQVAKVKSHPWIPKQISVRGFIYDVKNGKLTEVR
jgi:carbonic anhydrase